MKAENRVPRADTFGVGISAYEKIYGREKEIKLIRNVFSRVCAGSTELLLISGYAGVGKSSLAAKAYRDVLMDKGNVISGKFEEFEKNIPYSAIIQAFSGLIERILSEDKKEIDGWKEIILKAVAPNAQVIVNVIPALELILGKQHELPQLGPLENQNRFRLYFEKFTAVIAEKERPLVMFIDDLQWADIASLTLLKALISSPHIHNFLLIGAYRENEIAKDHPLTLILDEIKRENIPVQTIPLGPLKITDVCRMIADIVKSEDIRAISLAEVVFEKTNGNPFFIMEFLQSIQRENIINL
jgi:predicted ATPase